MRNSAQTQLLCTFSTLKDYRKEMKELTAVYNIPDGKIYVLQNRADDTQIYLTYNVTAETAALKRIKTISVHRKRDFNVIYSINALNLIVEDQSGNMDPGFQIDWSKYQSSLVIATQDNKNIHVIPTKLLTIFRSKIG